MNNQNFNPQNDPLKQNSNNSGPQFGTEEEKSNNRRNWISKYGSSVILPIIALLILAGGIYLYSTQKSDKANINLTETEQNELTEQEILDMLEQENEQENDVSEEDQTETESETEESEEEESEEIEIIPEITTQDNVITVKASTGNGITHLARYALKEYLKDHPQELTNEHKVYIEDYLKDQIGSRPLEIGEEINFSEESIREAITAADQLTDNQLQNLEKYSQTIIWD